MSVLERFQTRGGERGESVEFSPQKVEETLKKAYMVVRKLITPETASRFLVKDGALVKEFPSKEIEEWAIKKQEEYGIPHEDQSGDKPLLYTSLLWIYKMLEFFLHRTEEFSKPYIEMEFGLVGILEKIYGDVALWKLKEEEWYENLIEKYLTKIGRHLDKVVEEMYKQITGKQKIWSIAVQGDLEEDAE